MAIEELYNNNLSFRLAATGIAGIATIATGSKLIGSLGQAIMEAVEEEKRRQTVYVNQMIEPFYLTESGMTWDTAIFPTIDYQSAIDRLNENLGLNRLPEVRLMEYVAPGLMAKVWVQMQVASRMYDKWIGEYRYNVEYYTK